MKIHTLFNPRYKIVIHALILIGYLAIIIPTFFLTETKISSFITSVSLELISLYILALWIIPQLISNTKKGILLLFGFLIIYFNPYTFFKNYNNLNFLEEIHNLFTQITPIAIMSFFYSIIIFDSEKLKPLFLNKKFEILIHTLIIALITAFTFSPSINMGKIFFTAIPVYACAIFYYIHTFLLLPTLITHKKNYKYTVYLTICLITYYGSIIYFSKNTSDFHNQPLYLFIKNNFHSTTIVLIAILIPSYLYGYKRAKSKKEQNMLTTQLAAKNTELQLLKSQVNPHFLFNSLNTLYATALNEKADKTAESITNLASLIRYMQEDINKNLIVLDTEIQYIKDYISIQELRCKTPPNITTNFKNIKNHTISPGILMPFIENAFKYGINPNKNSSLDISIIGKEKTILFECTNTFNKNKVYHQEQGFGIGIKNTKQRLNLIYPNTHQLDISNENGVFKISLNINITKS